MTRFIGPVSRFKSHDAIALTFDDGPHPHYTVKVLDVLGRHNVSATFFMIGRFVERYPELVERIRFEGHAIANHSWDHQSFPFLSWSQKLNQIKKCAATIKEKEHRIFRPPYGHIDATTLLAAKYLGYKTVTWSVHAQDWSDRDSQWMLGQLNSRLEPGAILLLHDRLFDAKEQKYFSREPVLEALDQMLVHQKNNYRFLTLPQMFKQSQTIREPWYKEITSETLAQRKAHLKSLFKEEVY